MFDISPRMIIEEITKQYEENQGIIIYVPEEGDVHDISQRISAKFIAEYNKSKDLLSLFDKYRLRKQISYKTN